MHKDNLSLSDKEILNFIKNNDIINLDDVRNEMNKKQRESILSGSVINFVFMGINGFFLEMN